MRNSIKAVYAVGVTALIISGSAMAQQVPTLNNLSFGDLTTTTSDADCGTAIAASGASCVTLATGAGFIQRQISYNGNTYIQTMIDDGKGFATEDYVQVKFGSTSGSGVAGVASKLTLTQGDVTTGTCTDGSGTNCTIVNTAAGKAGFVADSTILSGWALVGGADGDSAAKIRVDLGDNTVAATRFAANFFVDSNFVKADDINVINYMSADQTVVLNNTADVQRFVTKIKPAVSANVANYQINASAVGQVDFVQDDQIQVVWVGQTITGLGTFGAENLTNLTPVGGNLDVSTSYSNLADTGPFNWTNTAGNVLYDNFGTAPTF